MTNDQALEILTQVAAKFVGTLQDHQQIQQALALAAVAFKKPDAVVEAN